MRTSGCPKCKNRRLLHIRQVADRVGEMGGGRMEHGTSPAPEVSQVYPWRIARVRNPDGGWLSSHVAAAGLVQAYVCRVCGYTELFTLEPERIQVDGETVVEIEVDGQAPYR